jgi:II/X family phage/plasmid replication protein
VIDWLTFVAPLQHDSSDRGPFYAGEVLSLSPDPTHPDGVGLEWGVLKRRSLEGSYSKTIQVQSTTDEHGRCAVWVSGNPAKWFQGHNLFGSDDLPGLVIATLNRVCEAVGVIPSADDQAAWSAGAIRLQRVDVTNSFDLGTLPRVRNALRSLDASANLKHRGRGHFSGDSLTFGKGSRRWSLTLYAKGAEIAVKGHELPLQLADGFPLVDHAQGLLRAEVRLLSLQLATEQLQHVSAWSEGTASELHRRMLGGLQIADTTMLDAPTLDSLPGRLHLAYQAWKDGHDLRATLSRPTFYRYRTELLKHGVDIAVKQERQAESINVVRLPVVLQAVPASVPGWAIGTPLYFEPRRLRVA